MKPYYESDGIVIYHADCREVLPSLAVADLLLTDPPYGIGKDGQRPSTGVHGGRKAHEFRGWDRATPDGETFALMLARSRNQIIWGANYFSEFMPSGMGWIVWDKGQRINQSDGELAFTSFDSALRIYTFNRVELLLDGTTHPTQKPLKLMTRCISHADKYDDHIDSICDPFMGSGTTLRAAKDLGRKAIGIEIEERYCEVAAKRMSQSVFDFTPQPERVEATA